MSDLEKHRFWPGRVIDIDLSLLIDRQGVASHSDPMTIRGEHAIIRRRAKIFYYTQPCEIYTMAFKIWESDRPAFVWISVPKIIPIQRCAKFFRRSSSASIAQAFGVAATNTFHPGTPLVSCYFGWKLILFRRFMIAKSEFSQKNMRFIPRF